MNPKLATEIQSKVGSALEKAGIDRRNCTNYQYGSRNPGGPDRLRTRIAFVPDEKAFRSELDKLRPGLRLMGLDLQVGQGDVWRVEITEIPIEAAVPAEDQEQEPVVGDEGITPDLRDERELAPPPGPAEDESDENGSDPEVPSSAGQEGAETETKSDDPDSDPEDEVKVWTRDELEQLEMTELREIGGPIGAKGNSYAKLIDSILEMQAANSES